MKLNKLNRIFPHDVGDFNMTAIVSPLPSFGAAIRSQNDDFMTC